MSYRNKGKVNKESDRAAAVRSTGSGPVANGSINSPPSVDGVYRCACYCKWKKDEEEKSVMQGKIRRENDDDDDDDF